MVKIYTKTGDDGTTAIIGGKRILKCSSRIEAYGQVDEMNAFLGKTMGENLCSRLYPVLQTIQNHLFQLGAALATMASNEEKYPLPKKSIQYLETQIDELESSLSPLTSFILPGGSIAASNLHIARTICRRVERSVIRLHQEEPIMDSMVFQYLNRLSDLLFVMARYQNQYDNVEEIVWKSSSEKK